MWILDLLPHLQGVALAALTIAVLAACVPAGEQR